MGRAASRVRVAVVAGAVTVAVMGAAGAAPAAVVTLTVYEVMALPPSLAGAVQETVAWALPAVAETAVGAPGTVNGVTELEASDAAPAPAVLVATTEKV